MNGNHIKIAELVKHLRTILEPNLRWSNHINILCRNLSRVSGIIAKLRHYADNKMLLIIYLTLAQSHLLYSILTWGSENITTWKPLLTIQNKIVRLMCKVDRTKHLTNKFLMNKRLGLLTITDLYEVKLANFFHSHRKKKKQLLQIFKNFFQPVKSLQEHFSRNLCNDNFYLPACSRSSFRSSIYFEGVQIWNNILTKWKSFSSQKFQKLIKNI